MVRAEALQVVVQVGQVDERERRLRGVFGLLDGDISDVALGLENVGDGALHARGRDEHALVTGHRRVPDTRQHIRNRVGQHRSLLPARLDDPGDFATERQFAQAQAELWSGGLARAGLGAASRGRGARRDRRPHAGPHSHPHGEPAGRCLRGLRAVPGRHATTHGLRHRVLHRHRASRTQRDASARQRRRGATRSVGTPLSAAAAKGRSDRSRSE